MVAATSGEFENIRGFYVKNRPAHVVHRASLSSGSPCSNHKLLPKQKKVYLKAITSQSGPYNDYEKQNMPDEVEVLFRDLAYFPHLIVEGAGTIVISDQALNALLALQTEGLEYFPISIRPTFESISGDLRNTLSAGRFFSLRPNARFDIVDIQRSRLDEFGTPGDTVLYGLSKDRREIHVSENIARCPFALFRGTPIVLTRVYFVSPALRSEWLRIGVSPHFFESCHH